MSDPRMPTPRPSRGARYVVDPTADRAARPAPEPNRLSGARPAPEPNRLSVARTKLPGVSGRASALVLGGLLLVTAIVVPLALHRALWVNAEAVLLVWFGIWTAALTWLGYTGRQVERDWGDYAPLWDLGRSSNQRRSSWTDGLASMDFGGADLGEGCLGVVVAILVLIVIAVVVGWLVPLVAIVLYATAHRLLNQAARHAETTQGRLPQALAHGALWAAVYTAPLGLIVWGLHLAQ